MTRSNVRKHFQAFVSALLANNKICNESITPSFETIPVTYAQKTFSDRAVVIGEAAGHVKPMTGGGILFSLIGTDMAASVLHDCLVMDDLSAASLSRYQREWSKALKRELLAGSIMQRIYTSLSNRQITTLFSVAKKKNIPHFLSSTNAFDFDFHGKLLISLCKNLLTNSTTN
jgi:flavin-dependent dehydrogenase